MSPEASTVQGSLWWPTEGSDRGGPVEISSGSGNSSRDRCSWQSLFFPAYPGRCSAMYGPPLSDDP